MHTNPSASPVRSPQTAKLSRSSRPPCAGCGKRAGGGLRYCYACLCLLFDGRDPTVWEFHLDRRSRHWVVRRRDTHALAQLPRSPSAVRPPAQQTRHRAGRQQAAAQNTTPAHRKTAPAGNKKAGQKEPTPGARTAATVLMNGAPEMLTTLGWKTADQLAALIDRLTSASEPETASQPGPANGEGTRPVPHTPHQDRIQT